MKEIRLQKDNFKENVLDFHYREIILTASGVF